MNNHVREALRTISWSALKYTTIDISTLLNDYYYPAAASENIDSASAIQDIEGLELNDAGVPFKGVHVKEACVVSIIGVDGEIADFSLTIGYWPYGGIGLYIPNTTATESIILLY